MSPADRPDPQHRILGIALQLAAYPPLRKHEHAYEARVPWRLIKELREALTGPTPALQRARADFPSSRQLDLVEMRD